MEYSQLEKEIGEVIRLRRSLPQDSYQAMTVVLLKTIVDKLEEISEKINRKEQLEVSIIETPVPIEVKKTPSRNVKKVVDTNGDNKIS